MDGSLEGYTVTLYVFDDFEFDQRLFELRRCGELVKIEPKVFNLLAYLIENRDRVVSKTELLEKLWPNEFVGESALTYCIKSARQALRDDGAAQRLIKTFQRRGYRFVAPVKVGSPPPAAADGPLPPSPRTAPGIWVGREREMSELLGALDQACQGQGRIVLLIGEPGIGKTRTADKLAAIAASRGARVLIGRCYEGDGAPAFWPWVQILRALVRAEADTELPRSLVRDAAEVTAIVPELRQQFPGLPESAPVASEQARFRLFHAVAEFLKAAANRRPIVLVIDDLHWADEPSLLLLQFLARDMGQVGILVVATSRDHDPGRDHPLTKILGELARVEQSSRIILTGLGLEEVRAFIAQAAGTDPSEEFVGAVYGKTEGNPFYVTEIVRLLLRERREPAISSSTAPLQIPDTVRGAIGRRLLHLSPDSRQLLSVAAVIGRAFNMNVLLRAVGGMPASQRNWDRARLLGMLDEIAAARIIEAVPAGIGTYRFSHALIREALYETLPASERIALHRSVGVSLEQFHRSNPEPHLTELAHHFFQAAPGGDAGKAFSYARRAGDRAAALLAYEDAADQYDRALQLFPLVRVGEPKRCEVLLSLGEARWQSGKREQAKGVFAEAATLARELDSRELFALAALGYGGGFRGFEVGLIEQPLIDLLEEAERGLEGTESALRARVLGRLAVALYHSPDSLRRRQVLSQEAVAMAARVGDVDASLGASYSRHWAIWGPDNLEERLEAANAMLRLAEQVNDREMALHGHRFRLIDLLEYGDISAVDMELERCTRLAEELRQPYYQWYAATFQAMRAFVDARFADADALAQRALTIGQRAPSQNVTQIFGAQLLDLRREQGRLEELEATLAALVEQYPTLPSWRCGLAYLYTEIGRPQDARTHFDVAARRDFEDLPRNPFWIVAMVAAADVCAALEDRERAVRLYRLLSPYADRVAVNLGTTCGGSVSRPLANLATTLGDWSAAARHYEDALQMNRCMKAAHFVAHTQQQYARMLLRRDGDGDSAKALELLGEALAIYERLEMKTFAAQAQDLIADARRAASPRKRPPASLAQIRPH
jgi:DNA-binding winged helix-turn-helix (wHTH) protein/tetratricopeptide (TPR) repeat protein